MNVSVRGDQELAAKLDALGARATNAKPMLENVLDDLLADERDRFSSNGYGRWKPLKPSTVRAKRRSRSAQTQANATRPLEATGRLRDALTQRGAPGQLLRITDTSARFGIAQRGSVYYGRFHQKGIGVPKRVVLQATPKRRKAIRQRVRDWIINGTP
jgi:phage gpG-like protein